MCFVNIYIYINMVMELVKFPIIKLSYKSIFRERARKLYTPLFLNTCEDLSCLPRIKSRGANRNMKPKSLLCYRSKLNLPSFGIIIKKNKKKENNKNNFRKRVLNRQISGYIYVHSIFIGINF